VEGVWQELLYNKYLRCKTLSQVQDKLIDLIHLSGRELRGLKIISFSVVLLLWEMAGELVFGRIYGLVIPH
jgi:hypothetical protein